MKKICACLGLAASLSVVAAAPALAGDRPYDRHVQSLIGLANDQLDTFANHVQGTAGEVVQDHPRGSDHRCLRLPEGPEDRRQEPRAALRQGRGQPDRARSSCGGPRARKASSIGIPASRAPTASGTPYSRPTPSSPAFTNIDWASDPATWRATRQTDREITALLGSLDSSVKGAPGARQGRQERRRRARGAPGARRRVERSARFDEGARGCLPGQAAGGRAGRCPPCSPARRRSRTRPPRWVWPTRSAESGSPSEASLDKVAMAFGKRWRLRVKSALHRRSVQGGGRNERPATA